LPHRTTISNLVSQVYLSLKDKFINKIKNIDCFGVTFDSSLHEYTGASYLTITLHYITLQKNQIDGKSIILFYQQKKCAKEKLAITLNYLFKKF